MSLFHELKPISRHGKNRVAEVMQADPMWTGVWFEMRRQESVGFSQRTGPWIFVKPDIVGGEKFARWVHLTNDPSFHVPDISPNL